MQKTNYNYTQLFKKHKNKIYIQSYKKNKYLKNSKQYNIYKKTKQKQL